MSPQVKKLTLRQHYQIHRGMARDFHRAEIKPFWMILWLRLTGGYTGFGYFEGGKRVGYMLFVENQGYTLLDHYAIEPECRSKGYGSAFFQAVCAKLPGLLMEVEDPAFAEDEADREKRARRIAFYERNGCAVTALRADVIGEKYCIMTGPATTLPPEGPLGPMAGLYRRIFGKRWAQAHIRMDEAK